MCHIFRRQHHPFLLPFHTAHLRNRGAECAPVILCVCLCSFSLTQLPFRSLLIHCPNLDPHDSNGAINQAFCWASTSPSISHSLSLCLHPLVHSHTGTGITGRNRILQFSAFKRWVGRKWGELGGWTHSQHGYSVGYGSTGVQVGSDLLPVVWGGAVFPAVSY